MLVKYWMRKGVITVDVRDSMQRASALMKEYSASLLPVLDKGKLVGVVTDRDLKRASASDATSLEIHELAYLISRITVGEIMTKGAITVPPNFTLEEAAGVLMDHNIAGAPVVDESGRITGIISQKEIFQALISLTGLKKRGVHVAFEIEDRPGSIKELTDIVREYGSRVVSILTSYDKAPAGYRHVYIRAAEVDRENVSKMIEDLRQKGKLLYMVDHREGKREEFVQQPVQDNLEPWFGREVAPKTKKILFCTDFSENSLAAQWQAVAFAKKLDAELLVLHVVNSRLLGYPYLESYAPANLPKLQRTVDEIVRENLDNVMAACRKEIPEASEHLRSGEAAAEIVPFAKEHSVDLIVMGTHGWTGFKHLILGSVAENVVRSAHCPVLTVRGAGSTRRPN